MLCMCWHSLVYAGMGVPLAQADEAAHALLHFEGAPHHHGHDHEGDEHGAFQQDESSASIQHALGDSGVFAPVLMGAAAALALLETASALPEALAAEPPGPSLLGLERPPKFLS